MILSERIQQEQEFLNLIVKNIKQSIFNFEEELKEYDNIPTDEDLIEKRNYKLLLIHKINKLQSLLIKPFFGKVVLFNPFLNQLEYKQYYVGDEYFNYGDICLVNSKDSEIGKLYNSNNTYNIQNIANQYFIYSKSKINIENNKVVSIDEIYELNSEELFDSYLKELSLKHFTNGLNINKLNDIKIKQNLIVKYPVEKSIIINSSMSCANEYLLFKRVLYLNETNDKFFRSKKLVIVPNEHYKLNFKKSNINFDFENIQIMTFSDLLYETLRQYNIEVYSNVKIESEIKIKDITFYNFIYSDEFYNLLKLYVNNQNDILIEENWNKLCFKLMNKVGIPEKEYNILNNIRNNSRNNSLLNEILQLNNNLKNELVELQNLKNNEEHFSLESEIIKSVSILNELNFRINEIKNSEKNLSVKYEEYYLDLKIQFFEKIRSDMENRKVKLEERIRLLKSRILSNEELDYLKWGLIERKVSEISRPNIQSIVNYILKEKYSYESEQIFNSINSINIYIHFLYSKINRPLSYRKYDYVSIFGFQNFNEYQYKMVRDISSYTSIYNLYGDLNQNLYGFALNINEIAYLFSAKIFNINVSYNNTKNIVRFIREGISLELETIANEGDNVEIIDIEKFKIKLKQIGQKNSKILIINSCIFEECNWILDIIHEITVFNKEIQVDLFDVYKIQELKYDVVFVFDLEMNNNEKYVAYSCAKEKLIIVR